MYINTSQPVARSDKLKITIITIYRTMHQKVVELKSICIPGAVEMHSKTQARSTRISDPPLHNNTS